MKCQNCGAELIGTEKFCNHCGTPTGVQPEAAPVEEAPVQEEVAHVQEEAPAAETFAAQPAAPVQPVQEQPAPPYMPAPAGQNGAEPPKKKKKKGLIILCAILGVIVILIAALFGLRYTILRSILGEAGYYAFAETMTVLDVVKDENFAPLVEKSDITFDSAASVTSDGQEAVSASVKGSYDSTNKKSTCDFSMDYAGSKVGPVSVNTGNESISISSPSISDKAITLTSAASEFDTTELSNILTQLAPIIKELEDEKINDKITVSKEEVDGKKYRTVTLALSEKDCYNLAADFLEKASANPELVNSIKKFIKDNTKAYESISKAMGDSEIEDIDKTIDEYLKDMPKAIENLRKEAEVAENGEFFKYIVSYKNSHEILQRKIYFDETWVTIKTVSKKNTKTVEVSAADDTEEYMKAVYTKESKGSSASFTFTMTEDGENVANIKSDGIELKKSGGVDVPVGVITFDVYNGEAKGTINMTADDAFVVSADITGEGMTATNIKITTTLKNSADLSNYQEPGDTQSSDEEIQEFFNALGEQFYGTSYGYEDYGYDAAEGGDLGDLSEGDLEYNLDF